MTNHLKRKWRWKFAFSMSLLSFVILYSVWHRVWNRMSSHNYIYFGNWSFNRSRKILYFQMIFDGCLQPCSSVNVLKAHIRWITTPFRVSRPIINYSCHYGHCITMVLCHISQFCSLSPKFSKGYWIMKIIYSVTKYLIVHPIIYFLSSKLTSKNSSDIYVIRHIIIK